MSEMNHSIFWLFRIPLWRQCSFLCLTFNIDILCAMTWGKSKCRDWWGRWIIYQINSFLDNFSISALQCRLMPSCITCAWRVLPFETAPFEVFPIKASPFDLWSYCLMLDEPGWNNNIFTSQCSKLAMPIYIPCYLSESICYYWHLTTCICTRDKPFLPALDSLDLPV